MNFLRQPFCQDFSRDSALNGDTLVFLDSGENPVDLPEDNVDKKTGDQKLQTIFSRPRTPESVWNVVDRESGELEILKYLREEYGRAEPVHGKSEVANRVGVEL